MRYVILVVLFFFLACNVQVEEGSKGDSVSEIKVGSDIVETSSAQHIGYKSESGGNVKFKVPLSPEYNWEVAQSWAAHCKQCDEKYPLDTVKYCVDSHTGDCCKYGWDFNLPGKDDEQKPVLASGNGKVKEVGNDTVGWGNYVVIDHGDNICTRYAHMYEAPLIAESQSVCQGLKIGKIGSTGNSQGPHLHFQFEDCKTGKGLEMGFDDGNEIPVCTKGKDVFDANGKYSALKLTNKEVTNCKEGPEDFSGGKMSYKGWVKAKCGGLNSCPLIPNCTRKSSYKFADDGKLDPAVSTAASYLYSECVLDGKSNGQLKAKDYISKAEALKIAFRLTGMMEQCGFKDIDFADVDEGEWYFPYIACAVKAGILDNMSSYFYPNKEVNLAEAAKLLVKTVHNWKLIEMKNPVSGHFPDVSADHWAYQFLETLYYYGGIPPSLQNAKADTKVKRGEYIVMAASLSPCFCPNVVCEGGCYCNQETFSCTDPNDNSSGTGGGGGGQKSSCFECTESYKQTGMCNVFYNGCGGFANCGPCPNGEVCKVGQCEKVGTKSEPKKEPDPPKKTEPPKEPDPPKKTCLTCASADFECDSHFDKNCGVYIHCGTCTNGHICVNGKCKNPAPDPPKQPEPPKQNCASCGQYGFICGTFGNGCGGTMNCGNCPSGQYCSWGKCYNYNTCSTPGLSCGMYMNWSTSTMVSCGGCGGGYECVSGKCKKTEPPKEPEPPKQNCKTCNDLGVSCGNYYDGCGKVMNCGSCGSGYTCEGGQCKKIEPPKEPDPPKQNCKTCSQMDFSCGFHFNGCNANINCGECGYGHVCENGQCKNNSPGQPKQNCLTCGNSGYTCGSYGNGCGGYVHCGGCSGGYECVSGQCKKTQTDPPKQPDPPKPPCKTCNQLGASCGTHYNGCGLNIYCGNCSSGYTCQGGQCKKSSPPPDPKPKNCQTCANTGYKCGMLYSNCGGGYYCGDCPFGKLCKQGKCYDKK